MTAVRVAKTLLTLAIAILVVSLVFSTYMLTGPGTFLADYYYLPLHEYVEKDKQPAMEEKVIDLWNAEHRRKAKISIARDALLLVSVAAVRLVLPRITSDVNVGV